MNFFNYPKGLIVPEVELFLTRDSLIPFLLPLLVLITVTQLILTLILDIFYISERI